MFYLKRRKKQNKVKAKQHTTEAQSRSSQSSSRAYISSRVVRFHVTYQHCIDQVVISWEERQSRKVIEAGIESVHIETPARAEGSFFGTAVRVLLECTPYQRLTNPQLVHSGQKYPPTGSTTRVLRGQLRLPVPRRHHYYKVAGIGRSSSLGHPVTEEAVVDLLNIDVDVAAWKVRYMSYGRDHSDRRHHRRRRRIEASPGGAEVDGSRKIRIRVEAVHVQVHYCLLGSAVFFSSLSLR
jgi:hypothetical protein